MIRTLGGIITVTVLTGTLQAGTFNVTRMDDPVPDGCNANDCSLREAVIDADQTVAPDTIILPAGVYLIGLDGSDTSEDTGDLDITTDMEFLGAPATIDGQQMGRIMDIRSGAEVLLRDLTLQNANTSLDTNGSLNGGALQVNGGSLTLDNVTFNNNSAQGSGGGIYAYGDAVVTIDDSFFTGNKAGHGAAINASTGITVRDTEFQDNRAETGVAKGAAAYLSGTTSDSVFERVTFDQNLTSNGGGALLFLGRSLHVDGLVATGNDSSPGKGGVLQVTGTSHAKQIVIVNALLKGNLASDGGAISFGGGNPDTLNIQHSSFVGNTVTTDGGALYTTGGETVITNTTFSGNEAGDEGGGIYLFGAQLSLLHTTFSEGTAANGNAINVTGSADISQLDLGNSVLDGDCDLSDAASLTSLGGNLEGPGDSCELNAGSDLVNQNNAQLGLQPLRDNPGGTPTHELTADSAARGQGETTICEMVKVDQLYETRTSVCNSGAVESNTIFSDSFESVVAL